MLDLLVTAEHDEDQEADSQVSSGKSYVKAERRRTFRNRRRTRGGKGYGSHEPDLVERRVHESVSLVGSSLHGAVEVIDQELDIESACTDWMEELADLQVDSSDIEFGETDSDSFDGAILMAPDDVPPEFADELPFGFHLENAGGAYSRHLTLSRLARAAQEEPDWGDLEGWDMGRYEPTHLIVRTV